MDPATEESFCNHFAASLLMPVRWLIMRSAGWPQSLASLATFASEAQVSLPACHLRLIEIVARWNFVLLRWRFRDNVWRLAGWFGLPRPRPIGVSDADDDTKPFLHHTDEEAFSAPLESCHATNRLVPITLQGHFPAIRIGAEIRRFGSTYYGLVPSSSMSPYLGYPE